MPKRHKAHPSTCLQVIYVLLRLPYAFRDLLNYQHPAQWVNTLNIMALIRLPLLLVLPYTMYEYVGTALVYSLRIWPPLVHLLRGPSHRPCPPVTWYLPNGSALERVFFSPSMPVSPFDATAKVSIFDGCRCFPLTRRLSALTRASFTVL